MRERNGKVSGYKEKFQCYKHLPSSLRTHSYFGKIHIVFFIQIDVYYKGKENFGVERNDEI